MPPPPPPPPLPDELVEEIFLRLPPEEPECLVRASLASKLWLGLLTGPAFRSRYGEHHGAPPMLGFFLSYSDREKNPAPHFVSLSKFGARIPDKSVWGHSKYESLDCRHGRVLLADKFAAFSELAVWNPMTGCLRGLGTPLECMGLGAAVLCAVTGCDHRACHQGPFRVILFGLNLNGAPGGEPRPANVWVWSSDSEAEEWTEPCSPLQLGSLPIHPRPSLLFENAIYHKILYLGGHTAIVKYDIGSNCMSLLDGPTIGGRWTDRSAILMAMEDDGVGFTYLDCFSTLYRWSRQIRSDGVATWTQRKVVDLQELLPIQNPNTNFWLIGFEENSGIVFVNTGLGIYQINLKSLEWKKLWKREKNIRALTPYMSFYNAPERVTPL